MSTIFRKEFAQLQPMRRKPSPNKYFHARFVAAFSASGLSQQQLADRLGIDKTTVWRWFDGKTQPMATLWPKLAEILGVTVKHLFDEPEEVTPSATDKVKTLRSLVGAKMSDEQILIPKLLKVAAGSPVYTLPDDARAVSVGRKSIESAIAGPVPKVKPETAVFAAEVHGDSMAPSLLEGDTLIVKRYIPSGRKVSIRDGGVYVLTPDVDGHAQVKRLLLVDEHQLIAVSDNQKFPPRAVDMRKAALVQEMIIGRVVKVIRDL